jgi:flagellar basal-body rod protein FlgB
MTDPIFFDKGFQAASFALDGLAKRQEMIGRNLSNVDTPGYHAQNVTFEDALDKAIGKNNNVTLATTNSAHLAAPSEEVAIRSNDRLGGSSRADGNNVDVDVELSQMTDTNIRYQALSQLLAKKYSILQNASTSH